MLNDGRNELEQPNQLWELLWRVRLSNLYHLKRERFLDGADRASKAVSALGGAAAFTQIRSSPDIGLWMTAVITVIATMSLVYGLGAKARKHAELARDFKRLEAEITEGSLEINVVGLKKLEAKYLGIESSEPPALSALTTHCHNELCVAYGKLEEVTLLPWYQKLLKNFFDFDQSVINS